MIKRLKYGDRTTRHVKLGNCHECNKPVYSTDEYDILPIEAHKHLLKKAGRNTRKYIHLKCCLGIDDKPII